MVTIKIGIVEDELIIAEKIKRFLLSMGYMVCEPVADYDEALEMIINEKPDLLLLDINLNSKKDGIDLAKHINEQYHLPFIFLTAYSDSVTVERAKKVKPNAYLVKPFNKEELFAAIEIAFNNYSESKNSETVSSRPVHKDFIFIRENHRFSKIVLSEIVFVESRENYVVIHARDKKSMIIRSTFSDFITQLPAEQFLRTHRGYVIRISAIENIEPTEISAGGFKIPISNTYRTGLFSALGITE